jgi:hypothetical protein
VVSAPSNVKMHDWFRRNLLEQKLFTASLIVSRPVHVSDERVLHAAPPNLGQPGPLLLTSTGGMEVTPVTNTLAK